MPEELPLSNSFRNITLFEKFVRLCAGRTGCILNLNQLASDTGISHSTAREWITLLEASFIIFLLPPFYANINKRLIKSPKLYFYDVGLASHLIGIENINQVITHPLLGHLVENMVIMEILKYRFNQNQRSNLLFYRDLKGKEIDLIYEDPQAHILVEIKAGQTINSDFFKNFQYFKNNGIKVKKNILIYFGKEIQKRESTLVIPFQEIWNQNDIFK